MGVRVGGKRATIRFVLVFLVVIGGVLMASCGAAIFPATQRLAAPIVCPAATQQAIVVTRWGGTSSGKGKSLHSDLFCMDAEGGGTNIGGGKIFLALFAIFGGAFAVAGVTSVALLRVLVKKKS